MLYSLTTTIVPRKNYWEYVQLLKSQAAWHGSDESDWYSHQSILATALHELKEMGIQGGRLAVFPFEVTTDGVNFDWGPLEAAIELMRQQNLSIDLCVGPLDYPYYPGIRLPHTLQASLATAVTHRAHHHLHVDTKPDKNFPELSIAIREYSFHFLSTIMERYGHDSRIHSFYLSNEWPDNHAVEGVEATITVSAQVMSHFAHIIKSQTTKKITLNTNIHPSEPTTLATELGPLLYQLGEQGRLGFDTYPTREADSPHLVPYMSRYRELMTTIRDLFPQTELVFTEFQAEWWPPDEAAGQSWVELFRHYQPEIINYYHTQFPPTLYTHLQASNIHQVCLWGSPFLSIANTLGYYEPAEIIKKLSETK